MSELSNRRDLSGYWRIIATEVWDSDALDLVAPAHLTLEDDGLGTLELVAISADVDYRQTTDVPNRDLEFSWAGHDEGDPLCGRGWAVLDGNELRGTLYIHHGDTSTFVAKKEESGRR